MHILVDTDRTIFVHVVNQAKMVLLILGGFACTIRFAFSVYMFVHLMLRNSSFSAFILLYSGRNN